jgi:hypothetical protein
MSKIDVNVLLIIIICIIACKDAAKEQEVIKEPEPVVEEVKKKAPEVIEIYVWIDKLRLRSESTTKSEIVATLKEGQALTFLNERSDFTEKISLRGTLFDEPWLKVKTNTGQEGWVYGGGVKFYKIGVDEAPTAYDDCFKLRKNRRISQSKKCLDRTQFRELKKVNSLVNESSSGLTIQLLSGEKVRLTNSGRDSVYTFRYYLKEMSAFVAHVQHRNKAGYLLIDDKTGSIIYTKGFPKASADKEYIACVNTDWDHKNDFNGIQLYGYINDQLQLIYEEEMETFRPVLPKWVNGSTLQFTLLEKADKRNRKSRYGQLSQKENGEWELEL